MNINQTELLQAEAWSLLALFHKKELALFSSPDFDIDLSSRLFSITRRLSLRWQRRSKKYLVSLGLDSSNPATTSYPDGFASSPALSSGALGQGAI